MFVVSTIEALRAGRRAAMAQVNLVVPAVAISRAMLQLITILSHCHVETAELSALHGRRLVDHEKSYGFRTFPTIELALYHSLGKLAELESAHDFF
jgi:hypothetical protein